VAASINAAKTAARRREIDSAGEMEMRFPGAAMRGRKSHVIVQGCCYIVPYQMHYYLYAAPACRFS